MFKGDFMKKKILSFVLAFCFLIPCALALNACNENIETEKCTVTKEEWNNAMDYAKQENLTISSKNIPEGNYSATASVVKYDGTKIYWSQWFEEDSEASLVEYYYIKDGNIYTKIEKGAKGNSSYTISKSEYDDVLENERRNILNNLSYDDFSFNEETKAYVSNDNCITVSFTFENGNLAKIDVVKLNNSSGSVPFRETTTITFEKVTITLP